MTRLDSGGQRRQRSRSEQAVELVKASTPTMGRRSTTSIAEFIDSKYSTSALAARGDTFLKSFAKYCIRYVRRLVSITSITLLRDHLAEVLSTRVGNEGSFNNS